MPPPFRPPSAGPFARFLSGVLRELGQPRQTGVYDRSAPGFMPMEFDPVTGVSSVSPTRVVSREEEEYETLRNLEGQRLGQGAFEADEYAIELAMQQPEGWQRSNALALAQLSSPAERAIIPFIGLGFGRPAATWLASVAAPALKSIPYAGRGLQYVPKGTAAFLRPITGGGAGKAVSAEAGAAYLANLGGAEAIRRTPEDAHPAIKTAAALGGAVLTTAAGIGGVRAVGKAADTAVTTKHTFDFMRQADQAMEQWSKAYDDSAWKSKATEAEWRYSDLEERGYAVPRGAESTGRWRSYPGRQQVATVAGGMAVEEQPKRWKLTKFADEYLERTGQKEARDPAKESDFTSQQLAREMTPEFEAARTGQPFRAIVFQGTGREDTSSIYTKPEIGNMLGDGTYATPDPRASANYGPTIRELEVTLENPYVVNDAQEWVQLTKSLGVPEYPQSRSDVLAIRTHIQGLGHDGVIVKVPEPDPADPDATHPLLKDLFQHDTVLDFRGSSILDLSPSEAYRKDLDILTEKAKRIRLGETPQELPVLGSERSTFDPRAGKYIEAVRDAFTATTRQQDLDARKGDLLQGREFEDRGWDPIQYEGVYEIEAELARRGVTGLGAQEVVAASGKYVNMSIATNKLLEESGMKRDDGHSFILDTIAESYGGNSITEPYSFARGDVDRLLVDIDDSQPDLQQQRHAEVTALEQELVGHSRLIGRSRIEETRIDLVSSAGLDEPPAFRPEQTQLPPKVDETSTPAEGGLASRNADDVAEIKAVTNTNPAQDVDPSTSSTEVTERPAEPTRWREEILEDELSPFTYFATVELDRVKRDNNLKDDQELAEFLDGQLAAGHVTTALHKYLEDLNISIDPTAPRIGGKNLELGHISHVRDMQLKEIEAAIDGNYLDKFAVRYPEVPHTWIDAALRSAEDRHAASLMRAELEKGLEDPWIISGVDDESAVRTHVPTTDIIGGIIEDLDWVPPHLQERKGGVGRTLLTRYDGSMKYMKARLQGLIHTWVAEFDDLPAKFYKKETMLPLYRALDPNTYSDVNVARESLRDYPRQQRMFDLVRVLLDQHEVHMMNFLKSADDNFILRHLNPTKMSQQYISTPNYMPRIWVRIDANGKRETVEWEDFAPEEKKFWQGARNNKTFDEMIGEDVTVKGQTYRYEPVSWHPLQMALRRIESGETLMLNLALVNHAKNLGIAKTQAEVNQMPAKDQDNFRTPKVQGHNVWKGIALNEDDIRDTPMAETPYRGGIKPEPILDSDGQPVTNAVMLVPNEFANIIELINGHKGMFQEGAGAQASFYKILQDYGHTTKRTLLLVSLFQHGDMVRRAIFYGSMAPEAVVHSKGKAIAGLILPKFITGHSPLLPMMIGSAISRKSRDAAIREMYESTEPIPGSKFKMSWPILLESGNLNIGGDESLFTRGMYDLIEDSESWIYGKLGYIPRQFLKLRKWFEDGLFQGMYRNCSMWIIQNLLLPLAERQHPDWTNAQRAVLIAEQANLMTSQMNPADLLLKNPTANAALKGAMFSHYENESLLRSDLRALPFTIQMPEILKGESQAAFTRQGIKIGSHRLGLRSNENFRAFVNSKLGTIIGLFLVSSMANWASTWLESEGSAEEKAKNAKLMHENTEYPHGVNPYNPSRRRRDGSIVMNRYFMAPKNPFARGPSGEPVYWDMMGQMDTLMRWSFDPRGALMARINAPWAIWGRFATESTFMSGPTRGLAERFGELVSGHLPIAAKGILETTGRKYIPGLSAVTAPGYDTLGEEAAFMKAIIGEQSRAQTAQELREIVLNPQEEAARNLTREQMSHMELRIRIKAMDSILADPKKWHWASNDALKEAWYYWGGKDEREQGIAEGKIKGLLPADPEKQNITLYGTETFIPKAPRQPDHWRRKRIIELIWKDAQDTLDDVASDGSRIYNYTPKRERLYTWLEEVSGTDRPTVSSHEKPGLIGTVLDQVFGRETKAELNKQRIDAEINLRREKAGLPPLK